MWDMESELAIFCSQAIGGIGLHSVELLTKEVKRRSLKKPRLMLGQRVALWKLTAGPIVKDNIHTAH